MVGRVISVFRDDIILINETRIGTNYSLEVWRETL